MSSSPLPSHPLLRYAILVPASLAGARLVRIFNEQSDQAGPSASGESMSLDEGAGNASLLDYMEQDRGVSRPKR